MVGARTYHLWQAGPWDLPAPGKSRAAPRAAPASEEAPEFQMANTRAIVEKNLFDPERGAVKKSDAVAKADDQSLQRIKSMVLLGTAILGSSRYAIVQDPGTTGTTAPGGRPQPAKAPPAGGSQPATGQTRLKLGDTVEGFKLAEIRERSVLFTKGANRVEVSIDFFRPAEEPPRTAAPGAPVQQRPGLAPRVRVPPAGEQAQIPGRQLENSSAVERARKALRDRQLQPPQQPGGRPPERENAPAQNPQ